MPQWFTIASALNGYVLDVEGGSCSSDQRVVTYPINGQDNQFWYQDIYNGVIRSKQNRDYVMDVADGTLCVNYYDADSITQKLICGEDRVHTLADPGMVLDIADNDSGSGAKVCLWEFNGGDNQVFSFNYVDQEYFAIRSALNGLVLDIEGGSSSDGAEVVTWEFNGQDNQLWYEDHYGVIRSKLNDFVLDCSYGDLVMKPFDSNNLSQGFGILGEALVNLRDPAQCVDIKDNCCDAGGRMCQWEYKGSENQHWAIEYL